MSDNGLRDVVRHLFARETPDTPQQAPEQEADPDEMRAFTRALFAAAKTDD